MAEYPPAALARIEAEISVALTEHHDQLVHRIAVALVEVAAAEHAAGNGNGNVTAPKLCTICKPALLPTTGRPVVPAGAAYGANASACAQRTLRSCSRLLQVNVESARGGLLLGERTVVSNGA